MAARFTCRRCGYETNRKGNLKLHFDRTILCDPTHSDCCIQALKKELDEYVPPPKVKKDPHVHACEICKITYKTRQGLFKHDKKYHSNRPTKTDQEQTKDGRTKQERTWKNSCDDRITELEKRFTAILAENAVLKAKIDLCLSEVNAAKQKECFYQNILESHLNGKHKKLPRGETDITTDAFHAEIKNWDCYKEAFGQLLAYNKDDPRNELRVYLFGKTPRQKTKTLII